jgi:PAS domain S-box-containing protein
MLYDTGNPAGSADATIADPDDRTAFVYREQVQIADRIWEFEYSSPREVVMSGFGKLLPVLALGGGLLTTLLLSGIVYTLATSRKRAVAIADNITRDLRDSEAGLAEAQRIARLGNWALDSATWTMKLSAETWRIFGLSRESDPVSYSAFLQQVHDGDRTAVDEAIRSSLTNARDVDIEHRVAMSDGSVRWVHTVAKPATRNRLGQVLGIVMDITARKHAAEDLMASHEQLQALSRRLVDIQESERRRFSAELHDVVGQNLTALSINLDIVKSQIKGDDDHAVQARLTDSTQLLQATSEAIENVMSELRPPMLDDYGLLPALQWYSSQFAARTGIHVKVQGNDIMQRLTPAAEIALFRVAQEALNNVAKHARARNVAVRIERGLSQCVMSVADDGQGMGTLPASPRRRPGLGMVTMRERMQAIGGTITVEGGGRNGTRVELTVPC